jgi:hypothetical protein
VAVHTSESVYFFLVVAYSFWKHGKTTCNHSSK